MTLVAHRPIFGPLPTPTTPGRGGNDWTAIVDQLAARPGEWASIATLDANESAGNRGERLRQRGVIVRQRSNGDGTATLWGCYVGTDEAKATPKATRTIRHRPAGPTVTSPVDRLYRQAPTPGPLLWEAS